MRLKLYADLSKTDKVIQTFVAIRNYLTVIITQNFKSVYLKSAFLKSVTTITQKLQNRFTSNLVTYFLYNYVETERIF